MLEVCEALCARRAVPWQGSEIKAFHDMHLSGGVEQSHKDGLAEFVDARGRPVTGSGAAIDEGEVTAGAHEAIGAMRIWWQQLLEQVFARVPGERAAG
jgi:hypothetical protein